jgi:cbb3-type cytochrome oxidase maturation protein
MTIIYLLIPLSLVLLGLAVWGFFWAVKNGQFDDLDSPALTVLEDDWNGRLARSEDDSQ